MRSPPVASKIRVTKIGGHPHFTPQGGAQRPRRWLRITETMNAGALQAPREKVTERGIDPAHLDAVRAVWEEPEPTVLVTGTP